MNRTEKLQHGTRVEVTIPFLYTIGEEGPATGKVLETIEDCENEVRAELSDPNGIHPYEFSLESDILP